MLVVDASVALSASGVADGFDDLGDHELYAPPLMWSESLSVLRELTWRGEVSQEDAERTRNRLLYGPVVGQQPESLYAEAWRISESMGWAKTYDAEYVALATILNCRLVTLDRRLRRATNRLGFVIGPDEL